MKDNLLIVSPHADDEILGCGGTILKYKSLNNIQWLMCTKMKTSDGYSIATINKRSQEINFIKKKLGVKKFINLDISPKKIEDIANYNLIEKFEKVLKQFKSNIIYLPYNFDIHSDHQIVTNNFIKCLKWFRYKYVKKILLYETLSETNFNFTSPVFRPNIYENIALYLEEKIKLFKSYKLEIGDFPFPRSHETIRSLAKLRGSESGYNAAEGFKLVYSRND